MDSVILDGTSFTLCVAEHSNGPCPIRKNTSQTHNEQRVAKAGRDKYADTVQKFSSPSTGVHLSRQRGRAYLQYCVLVD